MIDLLRHAARGAIRALTTADNQTPDIIRIGTVLSGSVMLFDAVWATVVKKSAPTFADFGGGIGALFLGSGLAIGAKRKDEAKECAS